MSSENQKIIDTKDKQKNKKIERKIVNYFVEFNDKYIQNSTKNRFLKEVKNNPDVISSLPQERLDLLEREYEKKIQILEMRLEKKKNKQVFILKKKKI